MSGRKSIILLVFIFCLALFLRLWQLGHVPPSPDWDEASLGYNAYSLLTTGRDEYGKFLPIVLRSFDDYKPALYAYFIIPFLPILGLTIYAVRMPSVFFGVLAVLATYFLVKELFDNRKTALALIASFLLAISPWHLQFSRIAFESQVGDAFNIFSSLFLLKGLKKPFFLILGALCMAVNMYIYQSEKVFTPLLLFIFVFIFRKQLLQVSKKYLITSVILGLLLVTPMIHYTLTNKEGLARAKGVSVFADSTQLLKNNALRLVEDKKNNDVYGKFIDNRRILFAKEVFLGYISHFNLNWLFINGDLARHHAPFMGLLYLWELPFLFIGIYSLLFGDFNKKTKLFILGWFLLVPIPASITSGVPHAVRTLNFLPVFQIFTAMGILTFFYKVSSSKYQVVRIPIKHVIFSLCILFVVFNFLYYLNQYFVQQNYYNSKEWQYGYEEAVLTVKSLENKYDKVIVTNKPPLDQSYIFFLFYLKYPPIEYQKASEKSSGGFAENHQFGKYEFRPILWNAEQKNPKTLYVGRGEDIPNDAYVLKTIYYLNSEPAIKIAE